MMTNPSVCEAEIVVCVPTYRRPLGLERCLRSLEGLRVEGAVRVIVGDNDPLKAEGTAVCRRLAAAGYRHILDVIDVPQRGIAPVRNALVAAALRSEHTRFIAMIDDDEWADGDWLQELLRIQDMHDSDVVGGPVDRVYETPLPPYMYFGPRFSRIPSGPIDLVDATSNILFRADIFRDAEPPWFDVQYALMGCEDKDLLLGLKIAGKRFAWSAAAVVTETFPASRCSVKWMLQRAYRAGNADMLLNLKHRPPGFNLLSEGAKIAGAALVATLDAIALCWYSPRRFAGLRRWARVIGKAAALFGVRHEEYRTIHGN